MIAALIDIETTVSPPPMNHTKPQRSIRANGFSTSQPELDPENETGG